MCIDKSKSHLKNTRSHCLFFFKPSLLRFFKHTVLLTVACLAVLTMWYVLFVKLYYQMRRPSKFAWLVCQGYAHGRVDCEVISPQLFHSGCPEKLTEVESGTLSHVVPSLLSSTSVMTLSSDHPSLFREASSTPLCPPSITIQNKRKSQFLHETYFHICGQ